MRFLLALAVATVANAGCTQYCGFMTGSCPAAFGTDTTACMAECAVFAATGTDADPVAANALNTLGCREYHAGVAATDAASAVIHCPHARPDSLGACTATGSTGTCDNYCDNLIATCPKTAVGAGYGGGAYDAADRPACLAWCANFADAATPFGTFPLPATATGELSCRRYHLQVARTDAATHCPHAGPTGAGVCSTLPAALCAQVTSTMMGMGGSCRANQTGFASAAACMSIAATFPVGLPADMAGDTLYCRLYHASVAVASVANAAIHCPHTGQQGAGACGSNCAAFCSQYMLGPCLNAGATAGSTMYATAAACETACATWPTGTVPNVNVGGENSLSCRLYHVGVASAGGATATTHCPHAAGRSVCVAPAMTGAPTPVPGSPAAATLAGVATVAVPALMSLLL